MTTGGDGRDVELARLAQENAELKQALAEIEAQRDALALGVSDARYHSVVSSLSEGVVLQDAAGAILACNPAAEQILGLTLDQMAGRTSLDPRWRAVRDDGTPFDGASHPAMVTLRTGRGYRNVIMGVHKPHGELTWISINSEPMHADKAGQPAVVCTFSDVSAHRRAMLELRASEERLRVALEAGRMGTWQYDLATGVVSWSARVDEVFDLPPGAFDGTLEGYARCIHPDDRATMDATLARTLAVDALDDSFHIVHRCALTREERWVECFGRVWRDAERRPVRMAGTIVDVTEHHRLEQLLVRGQRLEAVGRLAGGIAHDFNNVLTAIVGSAELSVLRPAQLSEHLDVIHASAGRGARLVQQLLTFSKRQQLQPEVLDVGHVVSELAGLLRRLAGESVELVLDLPPGAARVYADQGQLEQVLMNLVANARDALPRGGRVRIALESASAASDAVSLVVEDNGVGMPAHVVEHAFDPFFTTKEAGTGLGLATCYGIVEQLGGTIGIDSAEGRGTRMRVTLPRSHERPSEAGLVANPPPCAGSETILLVDDDPLVRKVTKLLLEAAGYVVLFAEHGAQALAVAAAHPGRIDLLLTDVVMPQMSGIELAQSLATQRPTTAVLLMSGYSGEALARVEGEQARNLPLLPKPYTRDELLERVRALLDHAARQRTSSAHAPS